MTSAIDEMRKFVAAAKNADNKAYLAVRLAQLEREAAAAVEPPPPPLGQDVIVCPERPAGESAPAPAPASTPASKTGNDLGFVEIQSFGWDQAGYGSKNEGKISVYVSENMRGVGEVRDNVTCEFGTDSFDLKVMGLKGRNYRLNKTNLEKDIVPEKCKFRVKADKITLTLWKKKGEYGYDSWTQLISKKDRLQKKKLSEDPTAGINDLMRQMYEDGDDTMRKAIGEAMLKSRQNPGGGIGADSSFDNFDNDY
jgi:calcyclin binding protein